MYTLRFNLSNDLIYSIDTSSLVRMMDESDTDSLFAISENFFDPLIENTPADRGERLAHHANFDSMITTIESIYSGCGNKKCASELVL